MNLPPEDKPYALELAERLSDLRPELLRYCRSLSGSDWEAEDLVQDTIIKVIDRCRSAPEVTPNRPYVFRAARNLWIDRVRKNRHSVPVSPEKLPERADPGSRIPDPYATREMLELLMHRLLPKSFVILLLCDVFQLTARQTASCIDMAEGSVQVALSRARSRLRQLAGRESAAPKAPASVKPEKPQGDPALTAKLLEAVTEVFRRHDPRLIYGAYLRLFESGSSIEAIRACAGRLSFTFRDPDGNMLIVTGEI
ncbi:sigma-70 family RNA polymerase sigma factor [Cohnella sp. CFH 77786]|uniref:RNA polymerase sigma factor n=1 Tax=Cohnella sp. CFH 77786 TaxID=2662265 RepID=UPI001C610C05|nr:RNA polymerase sigma factor [Cohnella sp. CFH 77786]MBW5448325.1 sigma-70 family RNA polymerase sigma factor [Cohnella sp. CFH 77786]